MDLEIPLRDEQAGDGEEQFIVSMTGNEWDKIHVGLEALASLPHNEVFQELANMIRDQVVSAWPR